MYSRNKKDHRISLLRWGQDIECRLFSTSHHHCSADVSHILHVPVGRFVYLSFPSSRTIPYHRNNNRRAESLFHLFKFWISCSLEWLANWFPFEKSYSLYCLFPKRSWHQISCTTTLPLLFGKKVYLVQWCKANIFCFKMRYYSNLKKVKIIVGAVSCHDISLNKRKLTWCTYLCSYWSDGCGC